eukprot:COSAG01_NODE_21081_length_919_cov_0.881707_1_plen_202_part_00
MDGRGGQAPWVPPPTATLATAAAAAATPAQDWMGAPAVGRGRGGRPSRAGQGSLFGCCAAPPARAPSRPRPRGVEGAVPEVEGGQPPRALPQTPHATTAARAYVPVGPQEEEAAEEGEAAAAAAATQRLGSGERRVGHDGATAGSPPPQLPAGGQMTRLRAAMAMGGGAEVVPAWAGGAGQIGAEGAAAFGGAAWGEREGH